MQEHQLERAQSKLFTTQQGYCQRCDLPERGVQRMDNIRHSAEACFKDIRGQFSVGQRQISLN